MSTLTRHPRQTRVVFCVLAASVALFAARPAIAAENQRKNPTSKLYVADVEGMASINTGEKVEDLTKKSVYSAEGVVLETKPNATNSIVLSNGAGMTFDPDTRVEMRRFVQEPFSPNRTDLEVEPSVSQTAAFIPRGSIGLCSSKMVAGSTMTFSTRQASLSVRGRKVVIEANDASTVVSMFEGEATVRGEMMAGGQNLKAGQQAIITRTSNSEPPTVVIQPIPPADAKRLGDKVSMACMARKTVYFEVSERKSQNAADGVFSQTDASGDEVIVPVEVLPGTIPPPSTVSPFAIP
ncbi:MAG TPA: hypothetical protein VIM44_08665 [Rariglobus sp.]